MHPRTAVLTRVTRDEGKNNDRVDGGRYNLPDPSHSNEREKERERCFSDRFNASPLIYVGSGTSKIFQALVKELARIYYSWLERERRVLRPRSGCGRLRGVGAFDVLLIPA